MRVTVDYEAKRRLTAKIRSAMAFAITVAASSARRRAASLAPLMRVRLPITAKVTVARVRARTSPSCTPSMEENDMAPQTPWQVDGRKSHPPRNDPDSEPERIQPEHGAAT